MAKEIVMLAKKGSDALLNNPNYAGELKVE